MYKLTDTKFCRDVKHQKYFTRVPEFSKILTLWGIETFFKYGKKFGIDKATDLKLCREAKH